MVFGALDVVFNVKEQEAAEGLRRFEGRVTATTRNVNREVDTQTTAFQRTSNAISTARTAVVALGSALAVVGIARFIQQAAQAGAQLSNLSRSTGVSVQNIQALRLSFDQAGLSASQADAVFEDLSERIGEARTGTGTFFNYLNNQDPDLLNTILSTGDVNQQYELVLDHLASITDATERQFAAAELVSGSANEYSDALARAADIRRANPDLFLTSDQTESLRALNSEIAIISQRASVTLQRIAAENSEEILSILNRLGDENVISGLVNAASILADAAASFAEAVAFLVNITSTLGLTGPALGGIVGAGAGARINRDSEFASGRDEFLRNNPGASRVDADTAGTRNARRAAVRGVGFGAGVGALIAIAGNTVIDVIGIVDDSINEIIDATQVDNSTQEAQQRLGELQDSIQRRLIGIIPIIGDLILNATDNFAAELGYTLDSSTGGPARYVGRRDAIERVQLRLAAFDEPTPINSADRSTPASQISVSEGNRRLEERRRLNEELQQLEEDAAEDRLTQQMQFIAEYSNAFRGINDDIIEFAREGRLSFKDFLNNLLSDIASAFISQNITDPLANALGTVVATALGTPGSTTSPGFTPSTGQARVGAAGGGYISGPGTSTSDSIPAMLSNGEFVLQASAVSALGINTLNKLNLGYLPKFQSGGPIGSINSRGLSNDGVTLVISPELNFRTEDERNNGSRELRLYMQQERREIIQEVASQLAGTTKGPINSVVRNG